MSSVLVGGSKKAKCMPVAEGHTRSTHASQIRTSVPTYACTILLTPPRVSFFRPLAKLSSTSSVHSQPKLDVLGGDGADERGV